MLKPSDVEILPGGLLMDRFGNAETEFAAVVVIRYHVVQGWEDWRPVTRRQLSTLFDENTRDTLIAEWAANPFWRPKPYELVRRGLITGWADPDDPGTLTPKFFAALEKPGSWKLWPREGA